MAIKFIDLGLSSGTKWATRNMGANSPEEVGNYLHWDEAFNLYDIKLPTKANVQELLEECSWEKMENGYKVIGPNGNSIFIPASGYKYQIHHMYINEVYLWTRSMTQANFCIALNNTEFFMNPGYYHMPIRLVCEL